MKHGARGRQLSAVLTEEFEDRLIGPEGHWLGENVGVEQKPWLHSLTGRPWSRWRTPLNAERGNRAAECSRRKA